MQRIEDLKKQLEKMKANGQEMRSQSLQKALERRFFCLGELDELNAKCKKFDEEKAEAGILKS